MLGDVSTANKLSARVNKRESVLLGTNEDQVASNGVACCKSFGINAVALLLFGDRSVEAVLWTRPLRPAAP